MKTLWLVTALGIALGCLAIPSVGARTWYVNPAGTGDALTVQAGIDSATSGDTVLVACGTYYEHDLIMKSGVCLKGENSLPPCVTIDAEHKGKLINCTNSESSTVIEDLLMINGSSYGMTCSTSRLPIQGPTVNNCIFSQNTNPTVDVLVSSPSFYNCIFFENSGSAGTIVIVYAGSEALISHCTFFNNSTGVAVGMEGTATIENCILAYCQQWSIYDADEMSWYGISCSDFYANGSPERDAALVQQFPSCFIADPQFCGIPGSDNFYLQSDSPCAPGNHPSGNACGIIGALPVLCGSVKTESRTWGSVKALYGE